MMNTIMLGLQLALPMFVMHWMITVPMAASIVWSFWKYGPVVGLLVAIVSGYIAMTIMPTLNVIQGPDAMVYLGLPYAMLFIVAPFVILGALLHFAFGYHKGKRLRVRWE